MDTISSFYIVKKKENGNYIVSVINEIVHVKPLVIMPGLQ